MHICSRISDAKREVFLSSGGLNNAPGQFLVFCLPLHTALGRQCDPKMDPLEFLLAKTHKPLLSRKLRSSQAYFVIRRDLRDASSTIHFTVVD